MESESDIHSKFLQNPKRGYKVILPGGTSLVVGDFVVAVRPKRAEKAIRRLARRNFPGGGVV